jgi:hypothetical protein
MARLPGRSTLNSHLPFSLSGSGVLLISVAVGALAGLYLFFRGFFLLQRKHSVAGVSPVETPAATSTITTTTAFTTRGSNPLTRDPHGEVIRLSPSEATPNGTASMTQQGKIAAALLKAGIPNPASWSAPGDHALTAVRAADSLSKARSATSPAQTLDRKGSDFLKRSADSATLQHPSHSQHHEAESFPGKPALMIWGGPVLTLTCIYILAAHFGWL